MFHQKHLFYSYFMLDKFILIKMIFKDLNIRLKPKYPIKTFFDEYA